MGKPSALSERRRCHRPRGRSPEELRGPGGIRTVAGSAGLSPSLPLAGWADRRGTRALRRAGPGYSLSKESGDGPGGGINPFQGKSLRLDEFLQPSAQTRCAGRRITERVSRSPPCSAALEATDRRRRGGLESRLCPMTSFYLINVLHLRLSALPREFSAGAREGDAAEKVKVWREMWAVVFPSPPRRPFKTHQEAP